MDWRFVVAVGVVQVYQLEEMEVRVSILEMEGDNDGQALIGLFMSAWIWTHVMFWLASLISEGLPHGIIWLSWV